MQCPRLTRGSVNKPSSHWCSLNEHRYPEVSQTQGVSDGAFFAEIRQGHYDPIDAIATLSEAPGLLPCFHRAVFALLWSQGHNVNTSRFQHVAVGVDEMR